MSGKHLDTERITQDLEELRKMSQARRELAENLYRKLMDVSSWWKGSSAEAMEEWAKRSYDEVMAVRDQTDRDIELTQQYVDRVIEKDRQYANRLAAFGSGNSIGTGVGSVAQQTSQGMNSLEFKEWVSKVTGVSADTNSLTEHFSKLGYGLDEVYWIYEGLKKNGVTAEDIGALQEIGYSFDDVVKDYSRITKITDKKIYSYMLKGGEYFDDIESRNPGSWKGMLTDITADGSLSDTTKIKLIDVTEGIGAYYRNTYNINAYNTTDPNAVTKATDSEKKLFNLCFEAATPEYAESIDTFFTQGGETAKKYTEQITDIKFIAYSAPESYRTVFLENIDKIGIGTLEQTGTQYYSSADKKLYINMADAENTASGPYQTFFHECGHAIDDRLKRIGSISDSYQKDGKTFKQTMVEDAERWIGDTIKDICSPTGGCSGTVLTDDQKENITHNLIFWDRDLLEKCNGCQLETEEERRVRDEVVNLFTQDADISTEVGGIASDIYGGLTGNVMKGSHGHGDAAYWYNEYNTSEFSSFGTGGITAYHDNGMLQKEFFAENFAAEMVGDIPSLKCADKYLHGTKQMMDELILAKGAVKE